MIKHVHVLRCRNSNAYLIFSSERKALIMKMDLERSRFLFANVFGLGCKPSEMYIVKSILN